MTDPMDSPLVDPLWLESGLWLRLRPPVLYSPCRVCCGHAQERVPEVVTIAADIPPALFVSSTVLMLPPYIIPFLLNLKPIAARRWLAIPVELCA